MIVTACTRRTTQDIHQG